MGFEGISGQHLSTPKGELLLAESMLSRWPPLCGAYTCIYIYTHYLHVVSGPVHEPGHGKVLFSAFQSVDGNYGKWLPSAVRISVVLCVPCSRVGVCQVLMGAGWQLELFDVDA